ncbi:MAG: zinc ABC transporter substrate-binding protein [Cyanobacteria bacterium SBLK]|nr:zinc ABC transporter substrate-binding protein [Cyanobacteria bacterium SBLK]
MTRILGKKVRKWTIAIVAIGVVLNGCNSPNAEEESTRPRVVATSTIIADLTAKVGGDEIELTGILKAGEDPHIYEPVPQDTIALERADLILYNGYNLEPALIRIVQGTGVKATKIAVGEKVKALTNTNYGQNVRDPHVWGDAENGIVMVEAIRDALIELSPSDREVFEENAEKLQASLQRLDAWIGEQIATIPPENRKLVTTHDAFEYYARAYGLEVTGTLIGMSTEEQPSAQTVKTLSDDIKAAGIPAIFAETTINPTLIKTVAQEAGVKLSDRQLYSDSIGVMGSEGDSYLKMLIANTHTIVEALGGQYISFDE